MSARPAFVMNAAGMTFAWHGELGPACARFSAWSREEPEQARSLGRAGRDRAVVPALSADAAWVAWCEDDGAWVAALGEDGAPGPARLAVAGAARIAFGGSTLFGADAEGIVAVRMPDGEARRIVTERRLAIALAACEARGEPAAVFAFEGDPSWGMVAVRDEPVVVRHRAREPVTELAVASAGSRMGVVLGHASGAVELAVCGLSAKVVERPHPVFGRGIGRLSHPDVVWVERGFRVLARTAEGALAVAPATGPGEAFQLPRVGGPFASACFHQHLHALEVEPAPDGGVMRLWRCRTDGSRPQQREDAVRLVDAPLRRRMLEAARTLGDLAARLVAQGGYRDGVRPTVEDGALRTVDERGPLTVRLGAHERRFDLEVAYQADGLPLPEAPSSMLRLARWIKHRIDPEARELFERERAWAESLAEAIAGELVRFDAAGAAMRLVLFLEALPDTATLERWLDRVRRERPSAT